MITQERLKELFEYDHSTGQFIRKKSFAGQRVGMIAGTKRRDGYIQIRVDGTMYRAHRLVWVYVNGDIPSMEIDHIDGDKSNNRIENLRDVTRIKNLHNQTKPRADSKTRIRGASKCGNKFAAMISIKGKTKYLGVYDTPEIAGEAYLRAKNELLRDGVIR